MQRRRTIASSPHRTAAEAWQTISSLIGDTLERSSSIERTEVDAALEPLDQLARMLIAAGHLETHKLVLVAGDLRLEMLTISGNPALTLEENLKPVPGGAGAKDWTLYVPQVEPMAKLTRATVRGHAHLSAGKPAKQPHQGTNGSDGVDLDALARWAREGP